MSDLDAYDVLQYTYVPLLAFSVLFMQAGMTLLQAGYARDRVFKAVMLKNYIGLFMAAVVWWWWGFGFAVGVQKEHATKASYLMNNESSPWWFLSLMYCVYAISIVSAAVADRIETWAFLLIVFVTAGATFPLMVNWVWTANVKNFNGSGWLQEPGVLDYAGSGVVNLVGGSVAMACVSFLGPRPGRFTVTPAGPDSPTTALTTNAINTLVPYNPTTATAGTMFMLFTWLSYLAAAAFIPYFSKRENVYAGDVAMEIAARSVCMGVIAVGGAVFTSTIALYHFEDRIVFSLPLLNESILGALVAISAGAGVVDSVGAFFIGVGAGLIALFGPNKTVKRGWDDVRNIHCIHVQQACWGLFAVGLWAKQEMVFTYTSDDLYDWGAFYGGRGRLLGYQILEAVVVVSVTWVITTFVLYLTNFIGIVVLGNKNGIRTDPAVEAVEVCKEVPIMVATHEVHHK